MTTILYHDKRLFADSAVYKGSDRLHCLDKIVMLNPPIKIISDKEDFVFDDTVYGYSGTGNMDAMAAFAKHLGHSLEDHKSSKFTMLFYAMMADSAVVQRGNTFECFMIGEKANHSFRFDESGFSYIRYELDQTVALGSGCQDVIRNVVYHRDPVRAMLETFITDTTSGGWIDCWSLMEQDGLQMFRRVGLCEPLPSDLIRPVMERFHRGSEEIPLQFVRNSKNQKFMTDLATENEKFFQQNKRLKKQLDILKKQGVPIPIVATTPVKQVIAKHKAKK